MEYFSEIVRNAIRTVPDWPEPGVQFRDITTALQDRTVFRKLIDAFVHRYHSADIDAIAAVDARGFILGSPLAYELNASFVPVRKKGKLPFDTLVEDYKLEYGTASVELHKDAFKAGHRVVLVDDLIATGGTMLAATRLLRRIGVEIVEVAAMIDLPDLGGSDKLRAEGLSVFTVCQFSDS
ncbi:adenine phosphoribosyltransferase [Hydrocarboniclastica marina]|uniref:Adenine phosphoribosyltransferase n=1 Tax=Hydrocarboniclastica marina TaxID=2259620 RepID=A0A4P7XIS6_9ALTE|nr:adenine phosphoribosyltransferase [Hydrocarboniclastica marina]MAL97560.1 adenine phosphoribosyltransferase [Alteromonadaceae bacterium]QCF26655.1 adenine phosphoribosyltransferase [Hydrocarboniclastica marina]|tara:strand:- start:2073 stop:2615 length:543 start_codon:yes stop_codon:yes gene_type:complete